VVAVPGLDGSRDVVVESPAGKAERPAAHLQGAAAGAGIMPAMTAGTGPRSTTARSIEQGCAISGGHPSKSWVRSVCRITSHLRLRRSLVTRLRFSDLIGSIAEIA
jgi:hypothetical protein